MNRCSHYRAWLGILAVKVVTLNRHLLWWRFGKAVSPAGPRRYFIRIGNIIICVGGLIILLAAIFIIFLFFLR